MSWCAVDIVALHVQAESCRCYCNIGCSGLNYIAPALFAMPTLGDISHRIVTSMLYAIRKNTHSTLLKMIEFVPIIGDFIPADKISTLLSIYGESKKKPKQAVIQ
jgi:hypothetical protein